MVKNPPASAGDKETRVQPLGWEDPLEEEMATHSSVFASSIPWTEGPASHGTWGHRESDTTEEAWHCNARRACG